MTLKIERSQTRVRLSGELRSEHLAEVRTELLKCGQTPVFDLEEVNLVDVEAVHFLNECEAQGIEVRHCSPYIREWMALERSPLENRSTGDRSHEDDN